MASKRKRPHNLIPREATVKLQLRLPKSLHRGLKTAARTARTSLHAEILRRCKSEFAISQAMDQSDQLHWIAELNWIAKRVQRIWEGLHGQQAAAGPASQNGRAAPQRASKSRDG